MLTKVFPKMTSLRTLDLGRNEIGDDAVIALAEASGKGAIPFLAHLNLSENKISVDGVRPLATAVKAHPALTALDLDGFELPIKQLKGTDSVDLSIKGLGGKSTIVIGACIEVNRVLTSLNLWSNHIGDEGARAIGDALRVNGALTFLDVGHNSLNEDSTLNIVRAARERDKMAALGVAGCGLGVSGAQEIAEYVRASGALTSIGEKGLNLRGNQLGDVGWGTIIAGVFASMTSKISSIDAGGSRIGPAGAKMISDAIRTSVNGALTEIKLSGNDIGTSGWCAICNALRDNKDNKIATWDLSEQRIDTQGAMAIADYVAGSRSLTSLNLASNRLASQTDWISPSDRHLTGSCKEVGATVTYQGRAMTVNKIWRDGDVSLTDLCGVRALSSALEANFALTSLNLAANKLCAQSLAVLAEALKINVALTYLNIDDNKIGDEGAAAICEAVRANESLTDLHLRRNDIGEEGAVAIGGALGVNTTLTVIELRDNDFGTAGWCAIFNALRKNKDNKIRSFDLRNQNIDAEAAKAVAKYARVSSALTSLNLQNNGLGADGAVAFGDALPHSPCPSRPGAGAPAAANGFDSLDSHRERRMSRAATNGPRKSHAHFADSPSSSSPWPGRKSHADCTSSETPSSRLSRGESAPGNTPGTRRVKTT
jgi:Ran GTPase-activating protein (RanGAP) involved in mRNA processing and transport